MLAHDKRDPSSESYQVTEQNEAINAGQAEF